MSNILNYFESINAQKQLNTWAKQLKNKKVVIYGAGKYFEVLSENYDLSGLNITGICDRKFSQPKENFKSQYPILEPKELLDFDCDIVLVALFDDAGVITSLEKNLRNATIKKQIEPIVEPTFWYSLKVLLGLNK